MKARQQSLKSRLTLGKPHPPRGQDVAQLFATADTLSLYRELQLSLSAVDSMMRGMIETGDRHGRLIVMSGQLQAARDTVQRWLKADEALPK